MAKKTISIDGEVSETLGGLAVRATRLRGGLREGVLQVELVAGATRVVVLPDRGLGIWKMHVGAVELGWRSPVAGPVHPRFVPLAEPSGLGWLDGFDELVARCGLVSNGAPDFDASGRLTHGLHGRVANLPAHGVQVVLDDSAGTVTLTGAVNETRFLCHALRMTTALTLHAGVPRLAWTDTVDNLSDRPTTMQMLYHVNFGPPLMNAGAEVVVPLAELAPRDAAAAADVRHARALWLPSMFLGPNWIRHDGQAQIVEGPVRTISKSSLFLGATAAAGSSVAGPIPAGGPAQVTGLTTVLRFSDAIFLPLAAEQVVGARNAGVRAATNDALLGLAESYLELQRTAGRLAIAREAAAHAERLAEVTASFAEAGVGLEGDHQRSLAERDRRRVEIEAALGALEVASTEVVCRPLLPPRTSAV